MNKKEMVLADHPSLKDRYRLPGIEARYEKCRNKRIQRNSLPYVAHPLATANVGFVFIHTVSNQSISSIDLIQ